MKKRRKSEFWKCIKHGAVGNTEGCGLCYQEKHKIGEHGAVGFLTSKGIVCAECGKEITKL